MLQWSMPSVDNGRAQWNRKHELPTPTYPKLKFHRFSPNPPQRSTAPYHLLKPLLTGKWNEDTNYSVVYWQKRISAFCISLKESGTIIKHFQMKLMVPFRGENHKLHLSYWDFASGKNNQLRFKDASCLHLRKKISILYGSQFKSSFHRSSSWLNKRKEKD